MNHRLYLEVFESHILPFIEKNQQKFLGQHVIFMQDGAQYYWHTDVKTWFTNHNIETMIWPPQSLDLNPIENFWGFMKNKVSMQNQCVASALSDMWLNLETNTHDILIRSMPKRVTFVKKNLGRNISH